MDSTADPPFRYRQQSLKTLRAARPSTPRLQQVKVGTAFFMHAGVVLRTTINLPRVAARDFSTCGGIKVAGVGSRVCLHARLSQRVKCLSSLFGFCLCYSACMGGWRWCDGKCVGTVELGACAEQAACSNLFNTEGWPQTPDGQMYERHTELTIHTSRCQYKVRYV